MNNCNQPLVSVAVVTYNSAKYVLDTLNSIKEQTYKNIELIISDDCSTDNTIELCKEWVKLNNSRFVRVQILISPKNTGVSANFNRAEIACSGEWVKPIAGDDLLLPKCIEKCIEYAIKNNTTCLFGKVKIFGATVEKQLFFENKVFDYSFFNLNVEEQLNHLIFKQNCLPAASYFYNRSKIIELGITNDERIPMLEDWPKWINLTKMGVKLHFIDKDVVCYRLSETSLSTTSTPSDRMQQSHSLLFIYYLFRPRFKSSKSTLKKLKELRRYIYSANNAFGGFFWGTLIKFDNIIARILSFLGCNIKI